MQSRQTCGGWVRAVLGALAIATITGPSRPGAAEGLDIEWVTVGDPGNPSDVATGRGSVGGVFQISKHEVTRGQYAAFLSAVAATAQGWSVGRQKPNLVFGAVLGGRSAEPVPVVWPLVVLDGTTADVFHDFVVLDVEPLLEDLQAPVLRPHVLVGEPAV